MNFAIAEFDYEALPERVQPFVPALQATERLSLELRLSDTPPQRPDASSVGGYPYMVSSAEHPRAEDGAPMTFIAQLNLADLPPLPGYPESGLLQFFGDNTLLGGARQQQGRVLYHPTVHAGWQPSNDQQLCTRSRRYNGEVQWGLIDPEAQYSIQGFLQRGPAPDPAASAWEAFEATAAGGDIEDEAIDAFDTIYDEYADSYNPRGHRLGGYPTFHQPTHEASGDDPELALLAQFDSDPWKFSPTYRMRFRDLGTLRYFIPRTALADKDFSAASFNWDT
ncbi:YwqG family protein [Mycobacterium sp. 134]|uniref:YwqG family protein n=1 Tax=Mycobacterium sp. 134 TaxID=3400425 RepID=UPI003AABDE79